jgi:hypothetical protein
MKIIPQFFCLLSELLLQQLLDLSLPFLAAAYQKEKVIPHETKPQRREKKHFTQICTATSTTCKANSIQTQ